MYNILKATKRLFEAEKTFEEIFTPFSSEELKGFRSEKIKKFLEEVKPQIIDNGDGTVDIEGNFNCSRMELESLEELGLKIQKVSGGFYCYDNSLTSLKGAPESVGEDFSCWSNLLASLEFAPKSVGESFDCSRNSLTSLEGAPKSVEGNFSCSNNVLTSLKGAPKFVGESFFCYDNAKQFTEEEVRAVCKVVRNIRV